MQKNFNVPLLDARGEVAKSESGRTVTIADVAISALTSPIPTDDSLTSSEKINLASMAFRIGEATRPNQPDGGAREFTKEELVTIKNRAAKNCQILAFGRLCEVIDSDEKTEENVNVSPVVSPVP